MIFNEFIDEFCRFHLIANFSLRTGCWDWQR
jgi:hypothetical protein